jgi:hypothetical protein
VSRNDGCISANGCAAKFAYKLLIIVLHAKWGTQAGRLCYLGLGYVPDALGLPTLHVVRHSTKLLSLVDFLDSSSPIALATLRAAPSCGQRLLSRLAHLGRNFVSVVLVLTQDWKSFVDKSLQIRIFHFGGSILKCTDRFIMIADHDFDVCRVEFGA